MQPGTRPLRPYLLQEGGDFAHHHGHVDRLLLGGHRCRRCRCSPWRRCRLKRPDHAVRYELLRRNLYGQRVKLIFDHFKLLSLTKIFAMSVYFVDHLKEEGGAGSRAPRQLPVAPFNTGLLSQEMDALRMDSELLQRTAVTLNRVVCTSGKELMRKYRCRYDLKLAHHDSCWQMKGTLRAIELRLPRSVHTPNAQEALQSEKMNVQAALSELSDRFEAEKSALDAQISAEQSKVDACVKAKASLKVAMESIAERRKIRVPATLRPEPPPAIETNLVQDLLKLSEFLAEENASHMIEPCRNFGLNRLESLASLSRENALRIPMPDRDLALLLSLVPKARELLNHGTANSVLTSAPHVALFTHRQQAIEDKTVLYQKLKDAIVQRDFPLFQSIMSRGGRLVVNEQNEDGWTLLQRATLIPPLPATSQSAEHGIAPDDRPCCASFLQPLVDSGANASLTNKYGRTALHYAAMSGNLEACSILLSAGAEPDSKDRCGMTPLEHARLMKKGAWERVGDLLLARLPPEFGASPVHSPTRKNKTPRKKRA